MILVAEGAADKSLSQLKNVLHLPSYLNQFGLSYRDLRNNLFFNSSGFTLDVNQALFVDRQRPIEESYVRLLHREYQTDYVSVDFNAIENAVKTINNHISRKTHGKIKQLVTEASLPDTHLLLSSAIHFNGAWKVCASTCLVNRMLTIPFRTESCFALTFPFSSRSIRHWQQRNPSMMRTVPRLHTFRWWRSNVHSDMLRSINWIHTFWSCRMAMVNAWGCSWFIRCEMQHLNRSSMVYAMSLSNTSIRNCTNTMSSAIA